MLADLINEVTRKRARLAALATLLPSHNPGNALVWRFRYIQEELATNGEI